MLQYSIMPNFILLFRLTFLSPSTVQTDSGDGSSVKRHQMIFLHPHAPQERELKVGWVWFEWKSKRRHRWNSAAKRIKPTKESVWLATFKLGGGMWDEVHAGQAAFSPLQQRSWKRRGLMRNANKMRQVFGGMKTQEAFIKKLGTHEATLFMRVTSKYLISCRSLQRRQKRWCSSFSMCELKWVHRKERTGKGFQIQGVKLEGIFDLFFLFGT